MKEKVPTLYIYFLIKINDKSKTNIITRRLLKEIISRILCKRGGVPKFMIKHVIDDMVKLGLVEKINNTSYKILKSNEEKKLRLLINYCI